MIPENLLFISAQPHDPYFQWQIEVQITNFRKFNVSDKMHILVWYPATSTQLPKWKVLQEKYPEAHFYFYADKGVDLKLYIPQLRPHILKQHFEKYPELTDKVFFYHDSDIIFRELPDFQSLVDGETCWESDCSSYLDYEYLRRKEKEGNIPEDEAVSILAKIGNATVDIIKSYTGKTGGAQTILKGIDSKFWEDVENQVVAIRKAFSFHIPDSINKKYFKSESAGFQSWCADMWALNFALWSRGIPTDVTPKLDFSWASDTAVKYYGKPIMHNAGATSSLSGLFYKGEWINKSPIGQKVPQPSKTTASYFYWLALQEVK